MNSIEQPVGTGSTEPYKLEIRNCSGGEFCALMSKGHHGKAAFMGAARAYWGEPLKGFDDPYHTWWRSAPDSTGEYYCLYHEAKPHARGAFPVTVICQY